METVEIIIKINPITETICIEFSKGKYKEVDSEKELMEVLENFHTILKNSGFEMKLIDRRAEYYKWKLNLN